MYAFPLTIILCFMEKTFSRSTTLFDNTEILKINVPDVVYAYNYGLGAYWVKESKVHLYHRTIQTQHILENDNPNAFVVVVLYILWRRSRNSKFQSGSMGIHNLASGTVMLRCKNREWSILFLWFLVFAICVVDFKSISETYFSSICFIIKEIASDMLFTDEYKLVSIYYQLLGKCL